MAYVTDDEAERIAGYRQQQGLASQPAPAPAPDPFANWQDTVDFAPPAVATYTPPAQNTWQDFGGGQGGYVEEGTGNIWSNGLWYDPDNDAVWNEPAGTWQQPQAYNDYWSQLGQHDIGFQNLFDSQPPEGAMATAPDFNEWWRRFDRNNGLAPTGEFPTQPRSFGEMVTGAFDAVGNQFNAGTREPYSLNGPGFQTPIAQQYDPRGAAFQASQRSQSNPFLEDFGASLQETGNLFADRTQRLPGLVEGLGGMFGFGGRAGGLPETEQLGEIYQKDILPNVSGNEFIRSFTPYEPENLPGPLPYLTDALAPINFATAGIASEVPVLGAMFKGPYLANLGAEMGIDIGARFGAEQAAGERGASIPLFGEQPAWLRGLEGGLIGGLGAAGAIKGADAGIPALSRYMGDEIEVAPGQFVSRGEFGGGKFGPVEPEPPKLGEPQFTPDQLEKFYSAPEDQLQALLDYTSTDYRQVSDYLRGKAPKSRQAAEIIDGLDELFALAEPQPTPSILYRGLIMENPAELAGTTVRDNGFVSASLREGPALGYAIDERVGYYGEPVVVTLRVPDGESLLPIYNIMSQSGDGEVLIDRGRWFRYGTPEKDADGIWQVTADLVDGPNAPSRFTPQPPKLAADAGPTVAQPAVDVPFPGQRAILDALQEQIRFRESGEAEALIRAGRATQASGIGEALAKGGSLDEVLQGASSGMRVGSMLGEGKPLNLADDAVQAATKEIVDAGLASGRNFDTYGTLKALKKLQDGEWLQPGEIKKLGKVFGSDVEDAIRKTNAWRIKITADLTPEDVTRIDRLAEVEGKKAARAEIEAQAQHRLADDLAKRARMDPTNKRLASAVDDARARALKLEADAERFQVERIEKMEAQARAKTQRAETAANREEVRQAEMRDKELAKQEAVIRKKAEDEWIAGLTRSEADPYAAMLNKQDVREARRLSAAQEAAKKAAGDKAAAEWAKSLDDQKPDAFARQMGAQEDAETRALGKFQDRARTRQAESVATRDYKESGQKALDSALALIEKSDLPPKAKAAASEFVEQMVKADGAILDTMKGEAPGFLRTVYAGATGEVSDSWVSALVEQRSIASGVLQDIGFDRKTANAIAKALSEMEVTRRWGPEPPPHIVKSLEQAKQKWADDSAIAGAASISQEWKNLMFGLFDIGIAGIQGLAAGTQGAAAILAGIVNRTLNVRALGVDTSPGNLAKRVQYGLDGRVRGGATLTGATDSSSGTLLRHIPGLKTVDQKVVSRAIGTMNDLQFRHAMGFLGDLIHEGQLVMLKLTGSDITDPLVRRRSADWANAISSAGKLAQRPGRALTERGFILSPSMVRSQSQVLGGMARILGPTTARETRILAATTVVSYGAVLLAIGKYLNDAIGTDDFEFDPSKPGFGRIRLENGTIISPFPQTQLARLLARSVRVLAEEGNGEQDPKMLGKAWTNFGIGRLSPAASMGAAAAGVGFDPDIGWRYGDLNEGKSWWEQAIENLAPTPPMVESLAREGFDPLDTSLEAVGLSNFKESEYAARDRALKADPRFQGRGWAKLEDWEKAIVNAEGGRVYSRDPQIKAQQERADVIAGDAKAYQEKIDQWQLRGEKPDGTPYTVDDWKRDRAKNDRFVAGRYEELYAGVDWKKDDLNPVDLYYKAIADAVDPQTDEVNWDKVDAWKATLSEEDRAYIERNTNLRDTVLEQQWRRDVKLLGDSGYFDTENKVAVRKADPEIAAAVRRWGYSEMSVKAEDTVLRYTAQQEVDDRSLAQGAITPEQWRENYNTRRDQLRAEKDGIYAGMKDDGVSTDPIDAYFKEIEKAVAPNGQDIDWQQVDAWVAQQPADVQAAINSYASPGLTPVVDQYRADVKKIVESQYWDVSDRVTQYWAKANGFDWTEGTDADKFWGDIQQEVYQRVQAKGLAPLEARSLTNVVMGQLQKDYVDVSSKVRAALRDSNPELARLLVQWGYWEPGKEDTGELIAAGTLR